jgi:hypothetical protein
VEQTAHHDAIERCFGEVRRRTRPMVPFVNVASVERITYTIFHASISSSKAAPPLFLYKQLDVTPQLPLNRMV